MILRLRLIWILHYNCVYLKINGRHVHKCRLHSAFQRRYLVVTENVGGSRWVSSVSFWSRLCDILISSRRIKRRPNMRGATSVWVTVRFRRKSALKHARQCVRPCSKVLTEDNRGVFRLFVCLQLAVLSCRGELCVFTASGTRTDDRQTGALPLRMTPPWPFRTSPHCASTEPCGDTRSLGGWKSPDAPGAMGSRSSGNMGGCSSASARRGTGKEIQFGINRTCGAFVFTFCTNVLKDTFNISMTYFGVFLKNENINCPYFKANIDIIFTTDEPFHGLLHDLELTESTCPV